jgi:menaquinol-cytochrome c reductase iron-sulfur subunit
MDNGLPVEQREPTRRRFYVAAIHTMGALIGAALGLPALVYLFSPAKARQESQWTDAGDVASLAPNEPVEMAFRRNRVDGWKTVSEKDSAWVVKHADQSVTAFGSQCTHLGCAYHWDDGKNEFICPCHNSLFSLDGKVISGPAPRPLDRYETKIQNGKLLLGKLRQSSEGQA